jgi:hypothetical protein
LDQAMRLFLLPGGPADDPAEDIKALEKKAKNDYFERWLAGKRAVAKKP